MKTITANVLRPVRLPAGAYLDGNTVSEATWIHSGAHEFDAALVEEKRWVEYGHLEDTSALGGCCCG